MIVPEIRYCFSPDVDELEHFVPSDPECFAFLVQMMIGPIGGPGEESFDVQVVTPRWLEEKLREARIMSGQRTIVVASYDWPAIETYLRSRVAECGAEDWAVVAAKLSRFSQWEFEDYRPGGPGGPVG